MEVELGSWVIRVDVAATREAYRKVPMISCSCSYCRNYLAGCALLPRGFQQFLMELGAVPEKASEVYELMEQNDGTHVYAGFYHFVGYIAGGDGLEVWTESKLCSHDPNEPDHDFTIRFTNQVDLVPVGFPEPVVQLEFSGSMPG